VWAKESNEGRRIDAAMVKELTGGDTLTVRDMYARPVTFKPSHTVLLMTNNKPHIPAEDIAIWERIILVPYEQRFIDHPDANKPNEHQADKYLKNKLEDEASGILAWLVRGCLEWQRQGLNIPKKLQDATNDYKTSEDAITQFIDERCKVSPSLSIKASDLYQGYRDWAYANGENAMSGQAFGRRIKRRFTTIKNNNIYYQGIDL
jgi:putative DNA primase/helicase